MESNHGPFKLTQSWRGGRSRAASYATLPPHSWTAFPLMMESSYGPFKLTQPMKRRTFTCRVLRNTATSFLNSIPFNNGKRLRSH
jgi:hypothetical protein